MSLLLFRIQDGEGRGPFKPGFSVKWRDSSGPTPPALFEELGIHPDRLAHLVPIGLHGGYACRSMAEIRRWFSRGEIRRLNRLGYQLVSFEPDEILVEAPTQVLIGMHKPLAALSRAA